MATPGQIIHEPGGCGLETKPLPRCLHCGGERPYGHIGGNARCRGRAGETLRKTRRCKRCARVSAPELRGKRWPDDFGKIPAKAEIKPIGFGPSV